MRHDKSRDSELDSILAPLSEATPPRGFYDRLHYTLEREKVELRPHSDVHSGATLKRRLVEWAVAASIGFAIASFSKVSQTQPGQEVYSDLSDEPDATEMRLVANSY